MTGLRSSPSAKIAGTVQVPGDKSVSHRALILGALALGETHVTGLLEGEDVLSTAAALRALGATLTRDAPGRWRVQGVGVGGLQEPWQVLDMGNAGTPTRLMMGVLATHGFTSFFTGDASLSKRPMARVATPLGLMGARVVSRSGTRLPLALIGAAEPIPIRYEVPVPSAQVKSAVLLAGLNTPGRTTVIERIATRDHTERMLAHFGVPIEVAADPDGGTIITVTGHAELTAATLDVPGDPSSAAFPIVAAALRPRSDILCPGVCVNPLRTGLFLTLREMGVDLAYLNERVQAGETVADIRVRGGALTAVDVPADRAPSMIDEYPVLAAAAACATGTSVFRGLAELRVKESDRLAAVADGLALCGARAEIDGDTLIVHGTGTPPSGGGPVVTHLDHRIAMAFLVLGSAAPKGVTVDDGRAIETSFPGFAALMAGIGCEITPS